MENKHQTYMQEALKLSEQNIGCTAPNPSVGCVIVKNNKIIAKGVTSHGGRPHAETIALEQAGSNAQGADLYVTLEPCCHYGKTHPCTDAIINAGIKRVFIGAIDPSKKVSGKGIKLLQKAGIEVTKGILEKEAKEINEGFLSVCKKGRPFVTIKLATSIDGKIATSRNESKWITNKKAREYAHTLRAKNDAIITGIGTVIYDNPQMTCRISGRKKKSLIRIVLDSNLRINQDSKILRNTKKNPTWVITTNKCKKTLEGVIVIKNKQDKNGRIDLNSMLKMLADEGITSVMVECGSKLSTSFIKNGLVDRIVWIKAPIILGNDGIPAIGELGIKELKDKIKLNLEDSFNCGDNVVEVYST